MHTCQVSIYLSIYPSIHPSIHLAIYPSLSLCVYIYICLSVCLSVCLSICLSIYLSFFLSIYLSLYLSICLSIHLSSCVSVYLSLKEREVIHTEARQRNLLLGCGENFRHSPPFPEGSITQIQAQRAQYSRFQKVGVHARDDLLICSFFRWFGVGGRSCSNFLASTVWLNQGIYLKP